MTATASETQKSHLPLTTTFTPPASCISNVWLASTSGKTWMNLGPINHTECLPSGWSKSDYYSPGICPTGYAIAASGIVIDGPKTETAATCCPTFGNNKYATRAAESSTISELIDCTWQPGPDVTTEFKYTWTDDEGRTSTTDSALSSNGHLNAYGVYIRWQSRDFSTPPATTPVSNTATTTTAAATSSQTSTEPSGSSELSAGAKAGIGVGVAVGAILAIMALALFFIRRRRARPAQYQQSHDETGAAGSVYYPPTELPTGDPRESTKYAVELPAGTDMPELDGSRK
ncbi:uncharacterized protein KD926_008985 [Aspergillus affinis]|uniref:uncharacterized protein n=1 Tax=Aspergillus affinis TaxID=1070780 RepID=UPI0022FEF13B|nr:uncharacterized protein KD926_008985 [Aspergillus affinis]KAI9039884.1 hypothetical protein KD926_008985 [Aspergillus affinis]